MGRRVYGGVEGGGTKFNCMIATGPHDVLATGRFPTAGAEETMESVIRFFQDNIGGHTLAAVGIASFGPVDLNPASTTYGYITTTPKPGWQMVDIAGQVRDRLGVPVGFDTDVNAAALGEYRWGAAQGDDPVVYITVGTGIGGGAYVNGRPVHGLIHPEMGHLLLPPVPGDEFPGICPYHGRCLEGMASGPALGTRAGKPAKDLAPDDPLWDLEARYLALAVANITYVLSPRRVILGGGVMEQRQLFPRIHEHVLALTNRYLRHPAVQEDIASYIVPPGLGARCGMLGAVELARLAGEAAGSET